MLNPRTLRQLVDLLILLTSNLITRMELERVGNPHSL